MPKLLQTYPLRRATDGNNRNQWFPVTDLASFFLNYFFSLFRKFHLTWPKFDHFTPILITFYPIFMSHKVIFEESVPLKRSCQFTTPLKNGSKNRLFNSQLLKRWHSNSLRVLILLFSGFRRGECASPEAEAVFGSQLIVRFPMSTNHRSRRSEEDVKLWITKR